MFVNVSSNICVTMQQGTEDSAQEKIDTHHFTHGQPFTVFSCAHEHDRVPVNFYWTLKCRPFLFARERIMKLNVSSVWITLLHKWCETEHNATRGQRDDRTDASTSTKPRPSSVKGLMRAGLSPQSEYIIFVRVSKQRQNTGKYKARHKWRAYVLHNVVCMSRTMQRERLKVGVLR